MRTSVLLLLLTLSPPALASEPAQGCEPGSWSLNQAEQAIADFNAVGAERLLGLALERWGCNEVASPADVSRFFLLQAWVRLLQGQEGDVLVPKYAAARRADPERFYSDLGEAERARWSSAVSEGEGKVIVPGLPSGWVVRLGGEIHDAESVPSGEHLAQLIDADGQPRWAGLVDVRPGGRALLGIPASAFPEGSVPKGLSGDRRRMTGWKVAGPAAMGVGLGGAVVTYSVARTVPEMTSDARALRAGNVSSWGVVLVGAGALSYGLLRTERATLEVGVGRVGLSGTF